MSLNTLPPEILERIFELTGDGLLYYQKLYLDSFALVCRKWASLAIPIRWKEVELKDNYGWQCRNRVFKFYRHIVNPYHNCGQYIRKLELISVPFWPVCIAKILQACPNIQDLQIVGYKGKKDKSYDIDLLDFIIKALPNLRKLDISNSHKYFRVEAIQNLIDTYGKKIEIIATRPCIKHPNHLYFSEEYRDNKWNQCRCVPY